MTYAKKILWRSIYAQVVIQYMIHHVLNVMIVEIMPHIVALSPERIVGYLAWTLGLQATAQPLPAADLIGQLDWQALPLAPTIVDNDQLSW